MCSATNVCSEIPATQRVMKWRGRDAERPEALAANGLLTGAHRAAIVAEASRLLADPAALAALASPTDAFGDGQAAGRVVAALRGG